MIMQVSYIFFAPKIRNKKKTTTKCRRNRTGGSEWLAFSSSSAALFFLSVRVNDRKYTHNTLHNICRIPIRLMVHKNYYYSPCLSAALIIKKKTKREKERERKSPFDIPIFPGIRRFYGHTHVWMAVVHTECARVSPKAPGPMYKRLCVIIHTTHV